MSSFYPQGMTLKALLENPSLLNPPKQKKNDDAKAKVKDSDDEFIDFGSAFLGPTLWDNTLPYDGNDFKLEYMDLDEFLSENGIPINPAASPTSSLSPPRPQMPSSGPSSPSSSSQPHSPQQTPYLSTTAALSPSTAGSLPPSPQQSPVCSPQKAGVISPFHGIGGASPSPQPASPVSSPPHQTVDLSEVASRTCYSPQSSNSSWMENQETSVSSPEDEKSEEEKETKKSKKYHNPSDQVVTVPGQDGFDPREHHFSLDELKPQPMIKKSRKVFVPEDLKDDKYWARRKKNNIAAKRSRDARRIKENQIAMRAAFLEEEHAQMKRMLEATQKENEILKEKLAKYEKQTQ